MPVCSVIGCKNRSGASSGISYHIFPKEPHIKEKWIDFTGRDDWFPKRTSTICSSHFKANDYLETKSKNSLKPDAFPSERNVSSHSLPCNQFDPSNSVTGCNATPSVKRKQNDKTLKRIKLQQQERMCEATSVNSTESDIYLLYVSDGDTKSQDVGEYMLNSTSELKNDSEGIKLQSPLSFAGISSGQPILMNDQSSMEAIKVESEFSELAACRGCLATDARLYDIRDCGLQEAFDKLAGAPFSILNGLHHLCLLCCSELSKYAAFRDRCQRVHELLEMLKEWGTLTIDDIRAIDRDSHKLTRSLTITDIEYCDCNENVILSSPVKTENDNISSVSVDTNLKELKKESEDPDRTSLDQKLIKDEQIKKDREKKPTTLEKRKSLGRSEISTEATNIDAEELEDPDETTLTEEHIQDEQVTKNVEKKPTTSKKRKSSGSSKFSRKAAKIDSGNNEKCPSGKKRKNLLKIGDDFYPDFDYKSFENEFKVKITLLNKSEQKAELEARKLTSNYLESPHRCETCGKGFTCLYTLTNHMANHDQSVGPFECEICHFRFADKKKLYKHRELHRLRFTCQECGYVTRYRSSARIHFETHTGKTYPCPHCARVFAVLSTCTNHVRRVHPELSVACDQCGETFQSPLGLQIHKTRAHRENIKRKNFKCPVCDVNFSSLEALDKHTSTAPASHTAVKPCVVCGESCDSAAALDQHTALRHPPDQYRCDECDTTFSSAAAFNTHHRRKHLGQLPQEIIKRPPRKHYLKYKNVRRVVCEICGQITQSEAALKIHYLWRHSTVKPFKCSRCPKSFATKNARAWHVRSHTGEKPHRCDLCPAAFSHQGNMKRHRAVVHLNQRQCIPCHLCSSTLTTPASMKVHINTVHNKMPMPKRKRRRKKEKKEVKSEH